MTKQFFLDIFEKTLECDAELQIFGGDLNISLNMELDKAAIAHLRKEVHSRAAQVVNLFLENHNWLDVWRALNPDRKQFTWSRKKPFTWSRLDYFLIPQNAIGYVQDCEIVPGIDSDHSFVSLVLMLSTQMKGPGIWKLNTLLIPY